jgi:hypothetical protein
VVDELGSRVAVLETNFGNLQGIVIDEKRRLNGNLERIDKRLQAMDEKLAAVATAQAERPSWTTALALTTLVGLVCTLITWIVTH